MPRPSCLPPYPPDDSARPYGGRNGVHPSAAYEPPTPVPTPPSDPITLPRRPQVAQACVDTAPAALSPHPPPPRAPPPAPPERPAQTTPPPSPPDDELPTHSQQRPAEKRSVALTLPPPRSRAPDVPRDGARAVAAAALQQWWRRRLPHAAAAWRRWAAAHRVRPATRCATPPPPAQTSRLSASALGSLCAVGGSRGTISRCPLLCDALRVLATERHADPAQMQLRARQLRHSLQRAHSEQGLRVLRLLACQALRRRFLARLSYLRRCHLQGASEAAAAAAAVAVAHVASWYCLWQVAVSRAAKGARTQRTQSTGTRPTLEGAPSIGSLWEPLDQRSGRGSTSVNESGWGTLLASGATAAVTDRVPFGGLAMGPFANNTPGRLLPVASQTSLSHSPAMSSRSHTGISDRGSTASGALPSSAAAR
eukprot:TRINITY_DN2145_c0_g3_i1.p1 TRINITY_DN2145_c0_g3~~TRINITY_DN2145_c0_g3_i1.p1  ORF type:complete len:424 (+),score=0.19 TRINITY_DN2145_c0_g3_i1:130-1401(+)